MRPRRATWSVGQPHDPLLAPFRTGHGRDQNPVRHDKIAKRLARRLDQAMDDDPIEPLARTVKVKSVLPPDRDIGEPEGLDPGGGLDRQRLEPLERDDRVRKLGEQRRAIACSGSNFADMVDGLSSSAAIIAATIDGGGDVCPQPIGSAMSRPKCRRTAAA